MRADVNQVTWRKSSYSNGDGGSCVEVSDDLPGIVPVRDSKLADTSPVIVFAAAPWVSFIRTVQHCP
ncbi:DUF397 domain-containing protein [Streptomyces amritsarensis]|uniref:DUF397 domain-containing protein n=2 Tax=Streptomyces amritsarensis TaxID=681158 RepID=A0ABX3GAY8_9ACTN|nr:DUF397 domain-containing protein [Streptomyces amritsarensis]OLZ72485.1 DUF397 domain-containing protein [Streptomyces amritsarensis]